MTHYYLYIECGVQMDENTRFFKVAIGQSRMGIRQKAWLESYAIEHGHYMVLWSLGAAEFMLRCRQSISNPQHDLEHITGQSLIAHLKTGEEVPATFMANLNRHHMMMQLDPRYYAEHCIYRRELQSCSK